jgi:regulator of protease activity HflC (stomatin/prohibitin superfamily)
MFFVLGLLLGSFLVALWLRSGLYKLPVGSRGLYKFLGRRLKKEVGEGWQVAPWPWSLGVADCTKQTHEFEVMKVKTKDNVDVMVGGSVIYRITDLFQYFNAKQADLEAWLNNTRKQIVRTNVRKYDQEQILGFYEELGNELHSVFTKRGSGSRSWGIKILETIIPEITPDAKVSEDMALQLREKLQQLGQKVEIRHFADMVKELTAPPPDGPGLSREQAVEQVQIALGQLDKKLNVQGFQLDSATTELIGKIFGRFV